MNEQEDNKSGKRDPDGQAPYDRAGSAQIPPKVRDGLGNQSKRDGGDGYFALGNLIEVF